VTVDANQTRKLKTPQGTGQAPQAVRSNGFEDFLSCFEPRVVVVSGRVAGQEFPLDQERLTLGRGPGVDVAFDDSAMSRQHAAIEFADERFRIQDLESTNGVLVNGDPVFSSSLGHGDRFQLGTVMFQIVIEERQEDDEAYILDLDA
jgi:pSer/pThr/pTyr-binding forkhead associated (FHA) protein